MHENVHVRSTCTCHLHAHIPQEASKSCKVQFINDEFFVDGEKAEQLPVRLMKRLARALATDQIRIPCKIGRAGCRNSCELQQNIAEAWRISPKYPNQAEITLKGKVPFLNDEPGGHDAPETSATIDQAA